MLEDQSQTLRITSEENGARICRGRIGLKSSAGSIPAASTFLGA